MQTKYDSTPSWNVFYALVHISEKMNDKFVCIEQSQQQQLWMKTPTQYKNKNSTLLLIQWMHKAIKCSVFVNKYPRFMLLDRVCASLDRILFILKFACIRDIASDVGYKRKIFQIPSEFTSNVTVKQRHSCCRAVYLLWHLQKQKHFKDPKKDLNNLFVI